MILHHVSVGVNDVERAGRFYDAVLGALGYKRYWEIMPFAIAYGEDGYDFWVQLPSNREACQHRQRPAHVAFNAPDARKPCTNSTTPRSTNGGSEDGQPGPRPEYGSDYYGAFVRDPDGNKIEATLHPEPRVAQRKNAQARKGEEEESGKDKRRKRPRRRQRRVARKDRQEACEEDKTESAETVSDAACALRLVRRRNRSMSPITTNEWGVPEYDDRALYEKLVLDGFQAGLSWITILKKRENFRKAFDDFDPAKIARYNEKKIEQPARRRRHHPQPRQDRGRDPRRAAVARHPGKGAGRLPRVDLEARRRQAQDQPLQDTEAGAGQERP